MKQKNLGLGKNTTRKYTKSFMHVNDFLTVVDKKLIVNSLEEKGVCLYLE